MKQEYSIKVGLLKDKEIKFIEGYMMENDMMTRRAFHEQKSKDLGKFVKGAIALDLYKGIDLIDTITISKEDYEALKNAA